MLSIRPVLGNRKVTFSYTLGIPYVFLRRQKHIGYTAANFRKRKKQKPKFFSNKFKISFHIFMKVPRWWVSLRGFTCILYNESYSNKIWTLSKISHCSPVMRGREAVWQGRTLLQGLREVVWNGKADTNSTVFTNLCQIFLEYVFVIGNPMRT
jgi:hypothetical protein